MALFVKVTEMLKIETISQQLLLLSPAFSKKSGGTLFLVFRGAWFVARGAWCVVCGSEFLVGTLSP